MITPEQLENFRNRAQRGKQETAHLGATIGFGRLMQLVQECWEEENVKSGMPAGSSFAYGPCVSMTVPCNHDNNSTVGCEWCNGSGWLTPKVKAVKDAMA